MNTDPTEFKLLRFNPRRAARFAPAAEVEITEGEHCDVMWMSRSDIVKNIEEFGNHPGLLAALGAYSTREEYPKAVPQ